MSFTLLLVFGCMSAKADALWVGQSTTCSVTIMGTNQYNTNWSVSGGYINLTGGTWATKTATVTQYFSGTATITCTYQYQLYYNGPLQTYTQHWTVSCHDNPLYIVPTSMNLEVGHTSSISPHLTYINSYNQYADFSYSSMNPSVASVNYLGTVTAVGVGSTNILVYCNASQNSCICIVNVAQSPTNVSITDSLSLVIGESATIIPELQPSNSSATFTWQTSDESVATISSEGVVTGVNVGTADITCVSHNGIVSNSCCVSVDWRAPENITVLEDTCFILQGEYATIGCNIAPDGANPTVSWSSRDEWIAPVNNSGLVAGYHCGSTYVVASTVNGLQDSCFVKVCQPAQSILIREHVSVAIGSQYEYYVSFFPENGFANDLQWLSSDTTKVRVENGIITGVDLGMATISVFNNNGLYAESEVYVKEMNQVNVWLQSGELYSYPLDFSPVLTYQSDSIHVDCWYMSASFALSDVLKITIADTSEPWYQSPCYAPENFEGTYFNQGETGGFEVNLSWSAPNELPRYYNLYREQLNAGTKEVIEIDGDATSYTDLLDVGSYTYRLTAVHEDCESDFASTNSGDDFLLIDVTSLDENADEQIVSILRIYTLIGQQINCSKIEQLPRGIYIIQGKTTNGKIVNRKIGVL